MGESPAAHLLEKKEMTTVEVPKGAIFRLSGLDPITGQEIVNIGYLSVFIRRTPVTSFCVGESINLYRGADHPRSPFHATSSVRQITVHVLGNRHWFDIRTQNHLYVLERVYGDEYEALMQEAKQADATPSLASSANAVVPEVRGETRGWLRSWIDRLLRKNTSSDQ